MSTVPRRTRRTMMLEAPERFDFFELMKELENSFPDRPRIGTATTYRQEIALPQQDPFLAFPDSNITSVSFADDRPVEISCKFMGMFGPMGPLPLSMTQEAESWIRSRGDPAFPRFADIFAARFVQLLYRAWAQTRPLIHATRPGEDRFRAWVGATIGRGAGSGASQDSVGNDSRLFMAGLLAGRVNSGRKLLQALRLQFDVPLEISERVGSWMDFEPDDRSAIGTPTACLGSSCFLGSRVFSVAHKIRVVLQCRTSEEYQRYLPGRAKYRQLVDFVTSKLGQTISAEIALTLPTRAVPTTRLGGQSELGWTTFLHRSDTPNDLDRVTNAAVFLADVPTGSDADARG